MCWVLSWLVGSFGQNNKFERLQPLFGCLDQIEDLEYSNVDAYTLEEEPWVFFLKAVLMFGSKKNKGKDEVVLIYGRRWLSVYTKMQIH